MTLGRTILLTALAMLAFAGNSLLCRLALKSTPIDPATFTLIRLASGALVLWLIARVRGLPLARAGSWASTLALFVYAAGFSYAYVTLPAGTGALLLFGAVQATMLGYGLLRGERLARVQSLGLAFALSGLIALLLPGLTAPPLQGALLMVGAGIAWGVYSLRGRRGGNPTATTAGNFVLAVPMAIVLSLGAALWTAGATNFDANGIAWAVASGALASGAGYAIWYTALPGLAATQAATVQLSVPIIAALGGVLLLGEPLTLRLVLCACAILGGIALVISRRR